MKWARVELAELRGEEYHLPPIKHEHAGLIVTLARQEWPDTTAYNNPELVWRLTKKHHVGFIVAAPEHGRVQQLVSSYVERIAYDFAATAPPLERPPGTSMGRGKGEGEGRPCALPPSPFFHAWVFFTALHSAGHPHHLAVALHLERGAADQRAVDVGLLHQLADVLVVGAAAVEHARGVGRRVAVELGHRLAHQPPQMSLACWEVAARPVPMAQIGS